MYIVLHGKCKTSIIRKGADPRTKHETYGVGRRVTQRITGVFDLGHVKVIWGSLDAIADVSEISLFQVLPLLKSLPVDFKIITKASQ